MLIAKAKNNLNTPHQVSIQTDRDINTNGMSFSSNTDWSTDTNDMHKAHKNYLQWTKPEQKKRIYHTLSLRLQNMQSNLQWQTAPPCQERGQRGAGGKTFQEDLKAFEVINVFITLIVLIVPQTMGV